MNQAFVPNSAQEWQLGAFRWMAWSRPTSPVSAKWIRFLNRRLVKRFPVAKVVLTNRIGFVEQQH
ncbi:MAG: hypothetical protein R3C03_04785 [Pirellulaceae bacterium]